MKPRLLLLALAFTPATLLVADDSDDRHDPRHIQVDAVADQIFNPDRAHLAIEIKAITKTFAASTEQVDAAFATLRKAALAAAVAEADVGVQFRSMARHYEWKRDTRVFKGNGCVERVEVIVRDLAGIGPLLEALAEIPNLELKGIEYRSSMESKAKREALLAATRAAREKAEAVAAASGVKVTGLWTLVELNADMLDSSGYSYSRAMMANTVAQTTSSFSGESSNASGAAPKIVRLAVRARYLIE